MRASAQGECQCNISFHLIFAYRSPRAGAHATHQAARQHRGVVEGPFLRPDQSAAKRKYWHHTTYRMRYRYQQSIRIRYYYVVRNALIGVSHLTVSHVSPSEILAVLDTV